LDSAGLSTALRFNLNMDSPFSFKCQVCSVCCSNKAIRVGPYEALRLSRRLGISTTDFLRLHTEEVDPILRNKSDGSCVFLGTHGCTVYPDRPLVCRLFPLGLLQDEQGGSRFGVMPLHPDCLGLIDTDGTVETYLKSQGAGPYFRYEQIYSSIKSKIFCSDPADSKNLSPTALVPGGPLSLWLDIDAGPAARGPLQGSEKSEDLDELVRLHVQYLEDWIGRP